MTAAEDQPAADDPAEVEPAEVDPAEVEPANPKRMLPKERQAGWLLVGVAGASVAASLTSGAIDGNNGTLAVGIIGLALVAVLGGAVWYGHRVITSFAAIIAGFAAPIIPVQFACLGFGGYLMFRTSRAQAKARLNQPKRTPAAVRQARATKTRRRGAAAEDPETARRPAQNRRYTPPKSKQARRGR